MGGGGGAGTTIVSSAPSGNYGFGGEGGGLAIIQATSITLSLSKTVDCDSQPRVFIKANGRDGWASTHGGAGGGGAGGTVYLDVERVYGGLLKIEVNGGRGGDAYGASPGGGGGAGVVLCGVRMQSPASVLCISAQGGRPGQNTLNAPDDPMLTAGPGDSCNDCYLPGWSIPESFLPLPVRLFKKSILFNKNRQIVEGWFELSDEAVYNIKEATLEATYDMKAAIGRDSTTFITTNLLLIDSFPHFSYPYYRLKLKLHSGESYYTPWEYVHLTNVKNYELSIWYDNRKKYLLLSPSVQNIAIYDLQGSTVFEGEVKQCLDLSTFKSGIYIVVAYFGTTAKPSIKKIIVD